MLIMLIMLNILNIYNSMGSRMYPEIGFIGKDWTTYEYLVERFDIKNLISSKKQGFSVNTVNMWNSYGKMIFLHYFDKSRLIEDKILNLNWIEKNVNKSSLDVRYVNKLLGILALEIWYRLFITQDLNSNEKLVI